MDPLSPCPLLSPRKTPEPGMPSSPTYRAGAGHSTRPKKLPTVTPRRFNRFFTPRNSQEKTPSTTRSARMPLGDISYSGGNRQPASSPIKQSRRLLDDGEDGSKFDLTPERPSPLKRKCLTHPHERPSQTPTFQNIDIPSSPPPFLEAPRRAMPRPVRKSAFRKAFGTSARRETNEALISSKAEESGFQSTVWQAETANFYSQRTDQHITYSCEESNSTKRAIPFSAAACHTNPLIAVSDEEGYVRLLDTEKRSRTPFTETLISYGLHQNAILGLEFSEDDLTLVTASGDQTATVFDVQKQEELYCLHGHESSLRQARFQPGSGGKIIATAGRDGRVSVWDLRCAPASASLHPAIRRGKRSATGISERTYAQWIHSFMPPVLVPKDADRRSYNINAIEKSVTAMSFLEASHPHYLMTGSATSSGVCLWDLRQMRTRHSSCKNAMVNCAWPNSENKSNRGVVKMALSGDCTRLYALCKDSTLYSYSMSQMLCKDEPIDALYGFRSPLLQVTSFYSGLSVRPAQNTAKGELIAATGGSEGPVVIPTDERYLGQFGGVVKSSESKQGVKIYDHGSVLRHGHRADLCDVVFTCEGNLVSVGDDARCRVWYDDPKGAAALRQQARKPDEDMRGIGWSEPAYKRDVGYLDDDDEEY